ncbi:MAG: hypothetical protein M1816_008104 [Peltula sp. TS41687]|nr:MAG: hypothetical protein M1816_008104 [Peltula sp. TS41687]
MTDELYSRLNVVKQAIVSIQTCSASTVSFLTDLLALDPELPALPPLNKTSLRANLPRNTTSTSQTQKRTISRTKRGANVANREVEILPSPSLSPHEKVVLATEVINVVLKVVTGAIKNPQQIPSEIQKDVDDSRPTTSSPRPFVRSSSDQKRPLQPRSLNRVSSSPSHLSDQRRFLTTSCKHHPGLLALAQCARTSFSYLRSSEASKNGGSQMPQLQLESGMSALVGKLIALGMDDLAVKELRTLKRRLQTFLTTAKTQGKGPNKVRRESTTGKINFRAEKDTLDSILQFEGVVDDKQVSDLIVATQIQALKLIVSTKRVTSAELILDALRFSSPNSVITLILKDASGSSIPTKTEQQLQTVSRLLFSLSPIASRSSGDDSSAFDSLSPEIALQIQQLAFKIRLLWWKYSNHRGDLMQDLISPLSRSLHIFSRQSSATARGVYDLASNVHIDLMADIETCGVALANFTSDQSEPYIEICKLLGTLSRDAKLYDEAIRWTEKALDLIKGGNNTAATQYAYHTRLAALILRAFPSKPWTKESTVFLKDAAEALGGSIRGAAADLEWLLNEVTILRRAALSILPASDTGRTPRKDDGSELPLEVFNICTSLVFASVRVFSKYLGSPSGPETDAKAALRYEQRKEKFQKSGMAAIDSSLYLVKNSIGTDDFVWETFDTALQHCMLLASALCPPTSPGDSYGHTESVMDCVAAKASNVYWACYLSCEKSTDGRCQPLMQSALRRSIDCARQVSGSGLGKTLLPVKLERLANHYLSRGAVQDGRCLLADCVHIQLQGGILQTIRLQLGTVSARKILDHGGDISIFGRALVAFLKTAPQEPPAESPGHHFVDDSTVEDEDRGCFLEWQLLLLSSTLTSTRNSEKYIPIVIALSDQLLKIYTSDHNPLRRMKIITTVLYLLANRHLMLTTSFEESIKDEAWLSLSSNRSWDEEPLARYKDHIRAALRVCLSLGGKQTDIDSLRQSLDAWAKIIEASGTLEKLEERIDDVQLLLDQLKSVTEFLNMKGLHYLTIRALTLVTRVQELQGSPDSSEMVAKLSALGLQYLNLGYSGRAGLALNKAQTFIRESSLTTSVTLSWHLVYAEYLIVLGSTDKCLECLAEAKALANNDSNYQKHGEPTASFIIRTDVNRLMADAYYVSSRAASERGLLKEALECAKKCVRINYRIWADLEGRTSKSKIKQYTDSGDTETDTMNSTTSAFADLTVQPPPVMSMTHNSLNGPAFWSLVPSLYRGLKNLSQLFSHLGLFQEALYYAEQARKTAEAIDAKTLKLEVTTVLADIHVRGGQLEKGRELIEESREQITKNEKSKTVVSLHCVEGRLYSLQGDLDSAEVEYLHAERDLEAITDPTFINKLDTPDPVETDLDAQFGKLSLKASYAPKSNSSKSKAAIPKLKQTRPNADKNGKSKGTSVMPGSTKASDECTELLGLRGDVFRLRATIKLLQRKPEMASNLLAQAAMHPMNKQNMVVQRIASSKQLLLQSLDGMAADAVFCVLEDSTISFPSIVNSIKRTQNTGINLSPGNNAETSLERSPRSYQRHVSRTKKAGQHGFIEGLGDAREGLLELLSVAAKLCSTSTVRTMSSVLSNATMLLAAATSGRTKTVVRPTSVSCYADIARSLAINREKKVIQLDKHTSLRDHRLEWPNIVDGTTPQSKDNELSLDPSQFQKQYIDIIPSQWSVILIGLSDDSEELFISKLQAGQSPFILRLPLSRNNSRDADEEIFDFKNGRSELLEIIDLANFTAHDARDMTRKGAKSRWWAEREALDARLKDLLINIENIWLGGFRGLFSQCPRRPDLLSRFQHSFQNILDKYLPSRLKTTRRRKVDRINLAPHILSLFVGLGDPCENEDMDESLMDLLYFVVDILQFHGEHNAYDEIDFDSIVIETKDALRYYYDAAKTDPASSPGSHTVLILDKGLHVFPWESLPCLDGLSVSRLPSLECLREPLSLQQEQTSPFDGECGFSVNKESGTYVLNPSGDLKSTQETLGKELQSSLQNWSSIEQREPTEAEMKRGLESGDLFLYFGHGSGSQYIKARTIRRLDRCAVSFLMGCSSGALNDPGEFEPYGTPMNYIHAGCPALVATLWDVTDKDIDRFSQTVFRSWGLLPPPSSTKPSGAAHTGGRKGRSRAVATVTAPAAGGRRTTPSPVLASTGSPVSLTKAVAQARDACVLKYLNGAATVVYGIPVYLS